MIKTITTTYQNLNLNRIYNKLHVNKSRLFKTPIKTYYFYIKTDKDCVPKYFCLSECIKRENLQ